MCSGFLVLMSVEFRVTSDFRELAEIAEARNASPEWRGVLEIKPSVNRVFRLRGRPPNKGDINDIYYDLVDFSQITISFNELARRLSQMAELEGTYYPLAENFALRVARDTGRYERIPDFIDAGKDLVAHAVWYLWRPERGEDFTTLNSINKAQLNRALKSFWYRSNFHQSFSGVAIHELHTAKPLDENDATAVRSKPRTRLKQATLHLSLPSVIATVDECDPIEKIASLAVMGYYPDGRGLMGVAKQIRVDRIKLGYALNRAIEKLIQTRNGATPERSIREIVDELLRDGKYRYASGAAVVRNSPRYLLLRMRKLPQGLSEPERKIVELALMRNGNTLLYSNNEEIGQQLGVDKNMIFNVIRNVTSSLQQDTL
ncbi:hypothetical protein A2985_02785 [Candidatus Woesebacteria bacterium RIFCSPLOWO2_01_FULL_43_11]|nr:MAG: hypothetical protein A2985_02785 [Candidatus Woesebacteria bacterium RIFCSPLOWO2_01_FULL_43_11]